MLSARRRRRRIAWLAGYAGLAIAPLVIARASLPSGTGAGGVVEFGIATGFLAFTLCVLQFALVSRVGPTSRDVGSDRLLALHRGLAWLVMGLLAAHLVLLVPADAWTGILPWMSPEAWRPGAFGVWALAALALTSVFRRRLGLSYEGWRAMHLAAAVVVGGGALLHALRIARYASAPSVGWTLGAYGALLVGFVARQHLLRPLLLWRRPYRLTLNEDAGGTSRRLRLAPDGHRGLRFAAGQYAWLITGRSPFSWSQHPLSIASAPADDGHVEFLVKALGDWSGTVVPRLARGTPCWIDGPYGGFVPHGGRRTRLVLVAGGIGVAPMRGILQDLAARQDRRPVTLIVAADRPARLVASDDIAALGRTLDLTVVPVFEHPDAGWTGERGYVTAPLIARRVPDAASAEYLICGPVPMIDAVAAALRSLGVPAGQVNTERFHLVGGGP